MKENTSGTDEGESHGSRHSAVKPVLSARGYCAGPMEG